MADLDLLEHGSARFQLLARRREWLGLFPDRKGCLFRLQKEGRLASFLGGPLAAIRRNELTMARSTQNARNTRCRAVVRMVRTEHAAHRCRRGVPSSLRVADLEAPRVLKLHVVPKYHLTWALP